MMFGPPGAPWSASESGSRDGRGAADHDQTYGFGHHLSTRDYGPFNTLQFARLLCLRSHVQDGDRVPEVLAGSPVIVAAVGAPACFDDNCPQCQAFLEFMDD